MCWNISHTFFRNISDFEFSFFQEIHLTNVKGCHTHFDKTPSPNNWVAGNSGEVDSLGTN